MYYYGISRLIGLFVGLLCLAIPLLLLAAWISSLVWVYKDAGKRGMSPWLWTLIVLLVPSFIGYVIYFLARSNSDCSVVRCRNCGNSIDSSSNVCPYCGKPLKKTCPSCGRPVKNDWRNCPTCGTNLYDEPYSTHNNMN